MCCLLHCLYAISEGDCIWLGYVCVLSSGYLYALSYLFHYTEDVSVSIGSLSSAYIAAA